ncbi:MAG: hypothetical protein JXM70_08660 [Pirellulales bacterium]|nr:hypothetical protein [Pirellulales bacterium]
MTAVNDDDNNHCRVAVIAIDNLFNKPQFAVGVALFSENNSVFIVIAALALFSHMSLNTSTTFHAIMMETISWFEFVSIAGDEIPAVLKAIYEFWGNIFPAIRVAIVAV